MHTLSQRVSEASPAIRLSLPPSLHPHLPHMHQVVVKRAARDQIPLLLPPPTPINPVRQTLVPRKHRRRRGPHLPLSPATSFSGEAREIDDGKPSVHGGGEEAFGAGRVPFEAPEAPAGGV